MTDGEKQYEFKVFETSLAKGSDTATAAGTIKSDGKNFVHVYCADGSAISLDEIQMAGKKRMKIKDFLLGFRNIEQFRFI